jgi:hypothetical protein
MPTSIVDAPTPCASCGSERIEVTLIEAPPAERWGEDGPEPIEGAEAQLVPAGAKCADCGQAVE